MYNFEILGGGARWQPDAVSSGRQPQMGARWHRQLEDSLLKGRHRETAAVRQDLIARRLDQIHHRGLRRGESVRIPPLGQVSFGQRQLERNVETA